MRVVISLLWSACGLLGQVYFQPQPDWLGLTPYSVQVCAPTDKPLVMQGLRVLRGAGLQGLQVASRATIATRLQKARRLSRSRKALLALEVTAWVWTTVAASGAVDDILSEGSQKVIRVAGPVIAGGLRLSTTMVKREARQETQPGPPLPGYIHVAAGECSEEYVIFSLNKIGENYADN